MHFIMVSDNARLRAAADVLHTDGHRVDTYDGSIPGDTDAILLPIPVTKDGIHITDTPLTLNGFFAELPHGIPVLGGAYEGKTVDVTQRNDFALLNAVPTAEGAIALAIDHTAVTLFDSRILITGFGRVARVLADRLQGLCPRLTVIARSRDALAEATALGFDALPFSRLPQALSKADLVFNTVPAPVFDETILPYVRPDTLFIELASRNAGFVSAVTERLHWISALGLPGKYAPQTAGAILAVTILNTMHELL